MSTVVLVRLRRAIGRVLLAAGALTLVAAACFLPFAGRFLVREDPLESADAIFVLAGGRVERWLESVDLYRERWAPTVVLSPAGSRRRRPTCVPGACAFRRKPRSPATP